MFSFLRQLNGRGRWNMSKMPYNTECRQNVMTLKHIAGIGRREEEQGGLQKELQRQGEGGQKGQRQR